MNLSTAAPASPRAIIPVRASSRNPPARPAAVTASGRRDTKAIGRQKPSRATATSADTAPSPSPARTLVAVTGPPPALAATRSGVVARKGTRSQPADRHTSEPMTYGSRTTAVSASAMTVLTATCTDRGAASNRSWTVRFSRSEAAATPMRRLPSSGSAMASEKPATDPEIDMS